MEVREAAAAAAHLSDFAHHCNRCFAGGRSHLVLDQVEHVLVVEQADQVERTEAGGAS